MGKSGLRGTVPETRGMNQSMRIIHGFRRFTADFRSMRNSKFFFGCLYLLASAEGWDPESSIPSSSFSFTPTQSRLPSFSSW